MPRFSERVRKTKPPEFLETEAISLPLRNSLWNYVIALVESSRTDWADFAKAIAQHFRKTPVDELPHYETPCRTWVKEYFYDLDWYEAFNFVEFLVDHSRRLFPIDGGRKSSDMQDVFNLIFEQEHSGYRFVCGALSEITHPVELAEVAGAIRASATTGQVGAHTHLETALTLFSKRPEPDYRNSIKESISAVESLVNQLAGSKAQGLSGALDALSQKIAIHGALRSAFLKLYGYSSDEDGIRHAILDEPNVGFDEAKYMIVSCSAFVNFLVAKAAAVGLLKRAG